MTLFRGSERSNKPDSIEATRGVEVGFGRLFKTKHSERFPNPDNIYMVVDVKRDKKKTFIEAVLVSCNEVGKITGIAVNGGTYQPEDIGQLDNRVLTLPEVIEAMELKLGFGRELSPGYKQVLIKLSKKRPTVINLQK